MSVETATAQTQTLKMLIAGRRIPVQAVQSGGFWTLTAHGRSGDVVKSGRDFARAAEALTAEVAKRIAAAKRR